MLLLVFAVVRAPDVALARTAARRSRAAPRCSPRSSRSSGARRRRSCGSGILRSARSCARTSARCCSSARSSAFQFVAVLYLQELRGWSSLETGLALLVRRDRRDPRADAHAAAGRALRQAARDRSPGMALAGARLRAVPAARAGLDVRRDAADAAARRRGVLARLRDADDRRHRRDRRGRAGPRRAGCSDVSLQFGAAVGLAVVDRGQRGGDRRRDADGAARRLPGGAGRAGGRRRRGLAITLAGLRRAPDRSVLATSEA